MSRASLPLICILFLGACDGAPATPDGGTSQDANVVPDASRACEADAECDDGLFCTGVEACVSGLCERTPMACDDGIACTIDTCSELRRRCESAPPDVDGDGFGAATCLDDGGDPIGNDCDDADANRFPGNREVCDAGGHDEDCDLETRGAVDADGDGFESAACCNPEITAGELNCGPDCDDARGSVNPIGTEVCDGLDQDCDGVADNGVTIAGFADGDFDGRGSDATPLMRCAGAVGFAVLGGDCDDTNFAISPDQPEICDGIRNDCTAEAPDVGASDVDWFGDEDGDGFGSAASGVTRSCTPIEGASLRGTDCDDTRAAINPAAAELCDGVDNDCNGAADFVIGPNDLEDDDADGFVDLACTPGGTDCNDADAASGPGEAERCDGIDNDCDGNVDEGAASFVFYRDADADGYGSVVSGAVVACVGPPGYSARGGDCNDADPARSPGVAERCNVRDDDCDGVADEDASGEPLDCSGVVDQFHAGMPAGGLYIEPGQRIGQSFTIGRSGQLIGLDIALFRLASTPEAGFYAIVDVRNPSGAVVATRRIADSAVPTTEPWLQYGTNGPAYLDLTSAEIGVTEGEVWSFLVYETGEDTCEASGGEGYCTLRSISCTTGADCGAQYLVGTTAGNPYSEGALLCPDTCAPPGVSATEDVYFRTVVRPSGPRPPPPEPTK